MKNWSEEELVLISQMRTEGKMWFQIGAHFGVSESSARNAHRALNKRSSKAAAAVEDPNRLQRVLFVPDTHVPFHDKRAFDLLLKVGEAWKPDQIVVLGDFADCLAVSFHPKTPEREDSFKQEMDEVNKALDRLDALGAKKKIYVSGNHEYRMDRYLTERAPALYSMFTYPDVIRTKDRGWEWVAYRNFVQVGKTYVTHDCGNAGANAAVAARKAFNSNAVIGHTHRMAMHYEGHATGSSTVGAMFGHLMDATKVDYMHKIHVSGWQLGFGIGHMQADGTLHMRAIPIINYACVVDGVLYEG
jgi:predicted phosphodiesterase